MSLVTGNTFAKVPYGKWLVRDRQNSGPTGPWEGTVSKLAESAAEAGECDDLHVCRETVAYQVRKQLFEAIAETAADEGLVSSQVWPLRLN